MLNFCEKFCIIYIMEKFREIEKPAEKLPERFENQPPIERMSHISCFSVVSESKEISQKTAEFLNKVVFTEKEIEKKLKSEPGSHLASMIKALDKENEVLNKIEDSGKRNAVAKGLIEQYVSLGAFNRAQRVWLKMELSKGAALRGQEWFVKNLKEIIDEAQEKEIVKYYKNNQIQKDDVLEVWKNIIDFEGIKNREGEQPPRYQELVKRFAGFGAKLDDLEKKGIGTDAMLASLKKEIPTKKQKFYETLKKEDFSDEQIEKIEKHYDGSLKYADMLRPMEITIAAMKDSPEKELLAKKFIKLCLAYKNYQESFLAVELIKNDELRGKTRSEILEKRTNYNRGYLKRLNIPEEKIEKILSFLGEYNPFRIYPAQEEIVAKDAFKSFDDLQERFIKAKEARIKNMEEALEILEGSKPTTEDTEKRFDEIKKTGAWKSLKEGLLTGGKIAGGVLLLLLLITLAPVAVGFYEGMKKMVEGFAKEAGIELKKKRGGGKGKKAA